MFWTKANPKAVWSRRLRNHKSESALMVSELLCTGVQRNTQHHRQKMRLKCANAGKRSTTMSFKKATSSHKDREKDNEGQQGRRRTLYPEHTWTHFYKPVKKKNIHKWKVVKCTVCFATLGPHVDTSANLVKQGATGRRIVSRTCFTRLEYFVAHTRCALLLTFHGSGSELGLPCLPRLRQSFDEGSRKSDFSRTCFTRLGPVSPHWGG